MKTVVNSKNHLALNYKRLAQEVKTDLLVLYSQGGSTDVIRNYWDSKMGELEELYPEFSERKLKIEVFAISESN